MRAAALILLALSPAAPVSAWDAGEPDAAGPSYRVGLGGVASPGAFVPVWPIGTPEDKGDLARSSFEKDCTYELGVLDESGAIGWVRVGGLDALVDEATVLAAPADGADLLVRYFDPDGRETRRWNLPADAWDVPPARPFLFATLGFDAEEPPPEEGGVRRLDLAHTLDSITPDEAGLALGAIDALLAVHGRDGRTFLGPRLRDYALGGGHLLIDTTLPFADGPGRQFDGLPFDIVGTSELRSLAEFEQWVDGAKIRFRGRVPAARFASDEGVVLGGTDGPLLLSRRFGFGRVTMFAPDLTAPPLSAWRSRDALLREAALLSRPPLPASLASATADGSLAGQLDRALATFDVVELPRGRVYVGLILLAAVVGPLDYLLVHRLLGRPRWTWATLPLLCVGGWFAVTSVGTASVGEGGDGLRAKSLTLRDEIVSESDDPAVPAVVARSRTLFALASPRHGRFDLTMTDAAGPGPLAIGWHAPPGEQFGGRDRPGRLDPAAPEYVVDAAARSVSGWPIPAGGAKMLRVLSSMTTPESPSVAADLASPGTRLRGTLTNATDEEWTDCRLVFGGRVYRPNEAGVLAAGQTWSLDADETLTATRTRYLRRAQVVEVDTGRDASAVSRKANIQQRLSETPYDPRSRDVGRIVEVLSLYRAAGGPDYTGLTDAGTEGDDFSGRLDEGRAVFLCEVADPAAPVAVAGADGLRTESTVVRRVVLPVATTGGFADRDLPDFDDQDEDAGRRP